MPLLFLPKEQAIADAPAVAQDNLRRPTINTQGVQQGLGQLGNASQNDLINPAPFMAPGQAMQAAGQDIQQAAGVFERLSLEVAKAQNDNDVMASEDRAAMKIAELQANRDPMKPDEWMAQYNEEMAAFMEEEKSREGLSPAARQQIGLTVQNISNHGRINTMQHTAVRTFAISKDHVMAQAEALKAAKRYPEMMSVLEKGAREGKVDEHTVESTRADIPEMERQDKEKAESRHEKAAVENITNLAMTDPEQAAELVGREDFAKIQNLKPTTALRMRNTVEAIQADQFRAAHADVMDAIVNHDPEKPVMTDQDVRDIAGKRARPADVEKMINSLHEYQTNTKKAEMAEPQIQRKLFGDLLDRVDKFDMKGLGGQKSEKARDEYWAILNESKWLPTVMRGEINGPLYQKWSASGKKPETTIQDYVRTQIQDEYARGSFGTIYKSDPKHAEEIDYDLKAKVNGRRADVTKEMAIWMNENPNAPREEVTKALDNIITKPMTKADAEEYLKNSAAHPIPDLSVKPEDWGARLGVQGEIGASGVGEDLVSTVKDFEGFTPNAFGDFKQTSIGYGTRAKHEGETLTKAEADTRLREELTMHSGLVDKAAKSAGLKLTSKQRDALISFDFNTGRGAYLLETSGGNMREVERRMRLYTKAGGEDQKGLMRRRKIEADMLAEDIQDTEE